MYLIFFKQLADKAALIVIIVLALHIDFTVAEKMPVFLRKIVKAGHGYKLVTAQVADLVFHVSLFPSGFGIHEYRFDAVVLTETLKTLRYITSATLNDFGDNGSGIVKPDLSGNPADVLKYGNQSLQKALHVFPVIKLEKAAVTEGKTEHKILGFVMKPAVFIKISGSKICLTFAGMMHKRNVAIGSL